MNNDELIAYYLKQLEEEQNSKAGNSYNKLRKYTTRVNNFGNTLKTTGDILKNRQMSKIGSAISDSTSALSNTLNKPVNYIKGQANGALKAGLQKLGLANTTAAGAGAAAGGSAASAALGPIAALAVMALMGTNRKRAKKSGRALEKMTNDIVQQGQDEQLANTQQSTAALQEEANQALQNGIATGGASNIFNGNAQPNQLQDPISLYQESLRQQGFNDDVVNGVRQGLNSGNKEIDQWIQQYNNGAGRENPINIPQTEEEIEAARAGVFNIPTQASNVASEDFESKVKQGLLDKFIDGITDLSKGYNENRNTAFNPENLRRRQDLATFKQSVNPADYTTKLTPDEQKQFDIWANDMRAKGAINPNDKFQDYDMQGYWKNEVLNNTDLANGNAEAHFTDKYKMPNHETFSNESIYATGDNAKYAGHWDNNNYVTPLKNNKMTRTGEILGTISRAAQKPAVQALLAGSISTALTGNPLYGVGMAQKFGANKVMTDVYRDILAKQGINIDPRLFGTIGAKDFDAIMLPELKKALYSNQAERIANDRWYKEHKIDIDQQNADSKAIQAGAAKTKADKYNGGGKGNTTSEPSGQYVIGETPNGRQVKVPIEKVKEFKSNGGKIVG